MSSAISKMNEEGVKQPTVLCIRGQYYLKLDSQAMHLYRAACFTDALESCFFAFYVYGVSYPRDMQAFYMFIEKLVGIEGDSGKHSGLVVDLWGLVSKMPASAANSIPL